MAYKVVVSKGAETELESFLLYLIVEKGNPQAAQNVLEDFTKTIDRLTLVADSLQYCKNPQLSNWGYRRINFVKHKYFMLYRIVENIVVVEAIFHQRQDFESKMI